MPCNKARMPRKLFEYQITRNRTTYVNTKTDVRTDNCDINHKIFLNAYLKKHKSHRHWIKVISFTSWSDVNVYKLYKHVGHVLYTLYQILCTIYYVH